MSDLLAGKTVLVCGVLTESSIGFAAARAAQQHGAQVLISNFGRGLSITRRIASRLPVEPPVLELDVTDVRQLAGLADAVREHADTLHGLVHAIAFAPLEAMSDAFAGAAWPDVATAVQVSTWSYAALTNACLPLLAAGSSVIGYDFDATVAWPAYGWMGVAKAGLESANRYLARELGPRGIRVNLISAGPLSSMAKRAIPGAGAFTDGWSKRAPLGWDDGDFTAVGATTAALLSELFPATTGEIIHVDGGYHALGA